ncbi:EscU/YscU/HrcU family type III secretion system export apparatus switch protein [Candidatus Nitrospira bockiana]
MERPPAPRRRAAAIEYQPDRNPAPRVTAHGEGFTAERIIELAREAGIPIREDPALVQLLMQFDLEACIPPELYAAVAELLAFLYHLDEHWQRAHGVSR